MKYKKYSAVLLDKRDGKEISDTEYFTAGSLIAAKGTATRRFNDKAGMWESWGVRKWIKDQWGKNEHGKHTHLFTILLTQLKDSEPLSD